MVRECGECGKEVIKEWKYCPFCGTSLGWNIFRRKFRIPRSDFKKIFENIERNMGNSGLDGSFDSPRSGISISIKKGSGSPSIKVRKIGTGVRDKMKKKSRTKRKIPDKIIEPEVNTLNRGSLVIHNIVLPGIKKRDIEVTKLQNSIEIRAFGRKKMYFKIIEAPQDFSILEKDFRDNTLSISVG